MVCVSSNRCCGAHTHSSRFVVFAGTARGGIVRKVFAGDLAIVRRKCSLTDIAFHAACNLPNQHRFGSFRLTSFRACGRNRNVCLVERCVAAGTRPKNIGRTSKLSLKLRVPNIRTWRSRGPIPVECQSFSGSSAAAERRPASQRGGWSVGARAAAESASCRPGGTIVTGGVGRFVNRPARQLSDGLERSVFFETGSCVTGQLAPASQTARHRVIPRRTERFFDRLAMKTAREPVRPVHLQ